MNTFRWIESEVPMGLEVRQVYGFIFSADGRVLLLEDVRENEEYAQVRMIALIEHLLPSAPDPSTGRQYRRWWVPPVLANDLLMWGDSGEAQLASAVKAASAKGVFWNGKPIESLDGISF